MNTWELLVIALGLSMDAFAVSICKGLSVKNNKIQNNVITGLYFGIFQGVMPLIGYLFGKSFSSFIVSVDHWVAFVLLSIIGGKMILDAKHKGCPLNCSFGIKTMLPLALATSIDALAIGVTLAFLEVQIVPAVTMIGVVTFVISALGIQIGAVFGSKLKSKAEFMGGMILVLMGLKILLEHLGVL